MGGEDWRATLRLEWWSGQPPRKLGIAFQSCWLRTQHPTCFPSNSLPKFKWTRCSMRERAKFKLSARAHSKSLWASVVDLRSSGRDVHVYQRVFSILTFRALAVFVADCLGLWFNLKIWVTETNISVKKSYLSLSRKCFFDRKGQWTVSGRIAQKGLHCHIAPKCIVKIPCRDRQKF